MICNFNIHNSRSNITHFNSLILLYCNHVIYTKKFFLKKKKLNKKKINNFKFDYKIYFLYYIVNFFFKSVKKKYIIKRK